MPERRVRRFDMRRSASSHVENDERKVQVRLQEVRLAILLEAVNPCRKRRSVRDVDERRRRSLGVGGPLRENHVDGKVVDRTHGER